MNEFQRLIAYLKILYHNLTTLHRNLVKDDAWFANHKQIGKWYEEVSDQIDDLVETGIALGYLEPGIKESVLEFSNDCLAAEWKIDETGLCGVLPEEDAVKGDKEEITLIPMGAARLRISAFPNTKE